MDETTDSLSDTKEINAAVVFFNHVRKAFRDVFEFIDTPLIKFTYHQVKFI